MRDVILHLFQRDFADNEADYKIVLDIVFGARIPKKLRNFPSFSEKSSVEEMLSFHCLTTDGINVNFNNFP